MIGSTLDSKYSIVSQLGQGGMGSVYLAKHLGTKRMVALKVITPRPDVGAEFVERFRREAEAAGGLRHPNVVDVTDFGFAEFDGEEIAYLVMEHLDGCTLAEVLEDEETLPLETVVEILDQVSAAVDEAHQCGIIHRDLKPQNIWIEPNRRGGYTVKVLDFGLAKIHDTGPVPAAFALTQRLAKPASSSSETAALQAMDSDSEAGGTIAWASGSSTPAADAGASGDLTQVGTVLGTPYYMSPEQCRGGVIDERSDVYALGVIVYEMISGRRPFAGDAATVMAHQVLDEPPRLADVAPGVPERVSDVVMAALAKDPGARPRSAGRFATRFRANAESVGRLLRRAVSLCSDHFPVFLRLFVIAYGPLVAIRAVKLVVSLSRFDMPPAVFMIWNVLIAVVGAGIATFFATAVARGVSALLLAQLGAEPLRSVRLGFAVGVLRRRLRPLLVGAVLYLGLAVLPLFVFFQAINRFASAMADLSRGAPIGPVGVVAAIALVVAIGAGAVTFHNFVTYSLFPIALLLEDRTPIGSLRRSAALVARSRSSVVPVAAVESLTWIVPLAVSFFATGYINDWAVGLVVLVLVATGLEVVISPVVAVAYAMLYLQLREIGAESDDDAGDLQIHRPESSDARWLERMRSRTSFPARGSGVR